MRVWELSLLSIALSLCIIVLTSNSLVSFLHLPQKPLDIANLQFNYDFENRVAYFHNQEISVPDPIKTSTNILGENSSFSDISATEKRIYVDLANQRLYAYEGDNKVFDFIVSTGKWGRTPTGTFRIWIKLRYTKMEGGSKAKGTYYYLPNVPYTMFFYNEDYPKWMGYGIHGTYWHENFGHPMSHGCINMKTEEVEKLYYWAMPELQGKSSITASENNPGTQVIIYGIAPQK